MLSELSCHSKRISDEMSRNRGTIAKPLSQNGYKMKLVGVAVKRALLLAAGAKPYWEA